MIEKVYVTVSANQGHTRVEEHVRQRLRAMFHDTVMPLEGSCGRIMKYAYDEQTAFLSNNPRCVALNYSFVRYEDIAFVYAGSVNITLVPIRTEFQDQHYIYTDIESIGLENALNQAPKDKSDGRYED